MANIELNDEQRKLIVDNIDLVELTAGSYYYLLPNFDDLISAAEEEICRAAILFDPAKDANFRTFASRTMTQNLKHHLRNLVPQYKDDEGNTVFVNVLSIDSMVNQDDEICEDELNGEEIIPAENQNDIDSREEIHNKFQLLMKGLTKTKRKLVLSRFGFRSQKSLPEMAKIMNMSERTVYEKVDRIVLKLALKADKIKKKL